MTCFFLQHKQIKMCTKFKPFVLLHANCWVTVRLDPKKQFIRYKIKQKRQAGSWPGRGGTTGEKRVGSRWRGAGGALFPSAASEFACLSSGSKKRKLPQQWSWKTLQRREWRRHHLSWFLLAPPPRAVKPLNLCEVCVSQGLFRIRVLTRCECPVSVFTSLSFHPLFDVSARAVSFTKTLIPQINWPFGLQDWWPCGEDLQKFEVWVTFLKETWSLHRYGTGQPKLISCSNPNFPIIQQYTVYNSSTVIIGILEKLHEKGQLHIAL